MIIIFLAQDTAFEDMLRYSRKEALQTFSSTIIYWKKVKRRALKTGFEAETMKVTFISESF